MKKALVFVLISVIVCFSFIGCKKSPVGTYNIETIDGMPIRDHLIEEYCDASELEDWLNERGLSKNSINEIMQLVISEDGTLEFIDRRYGGKDTSLGTWEESNGKIIVDDGYSSERATFDGRKLTLVTDGIKFVFKKK